MNRLFGKSNNSVLQHLDEGSANELGRFLSEPVDGGPRVYVAWQGEEWLCSAFYK